MQTQELGPIQKSIGAQIKEFQSKAAKLDAEWERLDSQGTGKARQDQIATELVVLSVRMDELMSLLGPRQIAKSHQSMRGALTKGL